MSVVVSLLALGFLIIVAYRGYSVILFAPVAALGAVLLTIPGAVLPAYSALFMDSMATYLRNYFPVFMLGALFGKLIELSGFAEAIAAGISRVTGRGRAMFGIVMHLRVNGVRRSVGVRRRVRRSTRSPPNCFARRRFPSA